MNIDKSSAKKPNLMFCCFQKINLGRQSMPVNFKSSRNILENFLGLEI
jgi:hypothetical protein